MATKLFLRNTTNNGITDTGDGIVYDMVTTAGSAQDSAVVSTQAGDNIQVQWTKTAGGSSIAWISGRVPSGGFTLTSADLDAWCQESNMNANCGARARVYRYQPGTPTITELGGPFDDDVEFGTATASFTWTANVTDTAFSENDRILLRLYIEDPPSVNMASGHTCTLLFNAADASNGDSFFNIAETVTFKGESVALSGTTTVTFSPSAILKGSATASGETTITFSPSAALQALAKLSGPTNLTFATSADLKGSSALSGSSPFTFTNSADLRGSATLLGNTSLTYGTQGALQAFANLTGLTSFTFSTAGDLTADGGAPPENIGDLLNALLRRRRR